MGHAVRICISYLLSLKKCPPKAIIQPKPAGVIMWGSSRCEIFLCVGVQVYELDTYRVTHASKYPWAVLSLGLSPDASLLAVGGADGSLSVRKNAKRRERARGAIGAGVLFCVFPISVCLMV